MAQSGIRRRHGKAVSGRLYRTGETYPASHSRNRMGRLAPGFAFGGPDEQRKLFEKEGVEVSREGYVDLAKYLGKGRV